MQPMTAKRVAENFITTDYQGAAIKRACLLRVLEAERLREELCRVLLQEPGKV